MRTKKNTYRAAGAEVSEKYVEKNFLRSAEFYSPTANVKNCTLKFFDNQSVL